MPRAPLGQHFLRDADVLRTIVVALEVAAGDTIVEIGAGHGELTREVRVVSKRVGDVKIIAIEKDAALASHSGLRELSGVEIVQGDVREILPHLISSLATHHSQLVYKLVGNIPYYLTGFLLRLISELRPLPVHTVLTMQKEVAERICAQPPRMSPVRDREGLKRPSASNGMNQLAASVQFWAKPKIVRIIPRSAFVPPPKVTSAVITLEAHVGAAGTRVDADTYYAAVHALFRQPRKTVLNNITHATHLPKSEVAAALQQLEIGSTARPQNLSLAQISGLALCFAFPRTKSSYKVGA